MNAKFSQENPETLNSPDNPKFLTHCSVQPVAEVRLIREHSA